MINLSKRIADWLEKASVGALWLGLFEGKNLALALCLIFLTGSLTLTWFVNRRPK
jgi:hypothetical protein